VTAESTRQALLAQHERIREHVRTCSRLAAVYLRGGTMGFELDRALEVLRDDFAIHNEQETTAIRRLMHGPAAWGSLMIDRMLEEHIAEHAAFWDMLSGTRREIAARIDDLADELDAHMAAEERTFLAPATLRDDVIAVRTREIPPE
jgi:hypothetical protein